MARRRIDGMIAIKLRVMWVCTLLCREGLYVELYWQGGQSSVNAGETNLFVMS